VTLEEARNAKRIGKQHILTTPLVPGAVALSKAVGLGIVESSPGFFKLALRVFDESVGLDSLVAFLRDATDGEVDVRMVGQVQCLSAPWYQSRVAPLEVGCSIGHERGPSGTLGAFATRTSDGVEVLLSNNHVIAWSNAAAVDDKIIQPGLIDKGGQAVATLQADPAGGSWCVPLSFTGENTVDAAIAVLSKSAEYRIRNFGQLSTSVPGSAKSAIEVAKVGRATGYRTGVVYAIEQDVTDIPYDNRACDFVNQIEIVPNTAQNFAVPGDSGSLVFQLDGVPIGLLFAAAINAAGDITCYANPLSEVVTQLGITLNV